MFSEILLYMYFFFPTQMDECGDLAEFDDSPISLSLINFSFKVSQLNSLKWNNVALFYIFSVAPAASFLSISSEPRIITCKRLPY